MEIEWWGIIVLILVGAGVGFAGHWLQARLKMQSASHKSELLVQNAQSKVDVLLRDAKIEAQEEVLKARNSFEEENKTRRAELKVLEEKIDSKEQNLDRKVSMLDRKEENIDKKLEDIEKSKDALVEQKKDLDQLIQDERDQIQQVADMSEEEARQTLMDRLEESLKGESASLIKHAQEEAHAVAEKEARKIITLAIERYAAEQVNEITTSTVPLPNDEMKGRIIGKEGRNIRSLESLTGVNILIDDTPEVVVVSGFDPLRREVARQSLERLILDGRIHPARIEEIVIKVQEELDESIRNAGEAAIYELGLRNVAPELVKTLGRLNYRYSYSQNILKHSLEMAHLMGMMASELGLDESIARRAGIFHDIGKALTHEVEGGHALIGADLIKKHGEDQVVVNAVAAHHGDVEPESLYATLVIAADAIT
ncbi:MAG: ribonuclease Y, partial [Verrucomicrobiota bacterium]